MSIYVLNSDCRLSCSWWAYKYFNSSVMSKDTGSHYNLSPHSDNLWGVSVHLFVYIHKTHRYFVI